MRAIHTFSSISGLLPFDDSVNILHTLYYPDRRFGYGKLENPLREHEVLSNLFSGNRPAVNRVNVT